MKEDNFSTLFRFPRQKRNNIEKSVKAMNRSALRPDGPSVLQTLLRWFDSEVGPDQPSGGEDKTVDWLRILPLAFLHVMCLGVIWVGWSPVAEEIKRPTCNRIQGRRK